MNVLMRLFVVGVIGICSVASLSAQPGREPRVSGCIIAIASVAEHPGCTPMHSERFGLRAVAADGVIGTTDEQLFPLQCFLAIGLEGVHDSIADRVTLKIIRDDDTVHTMNIVLSGTFINRELYLVDTLLFRPGTWCVDINRGRAGREPKEGTSRTTVRIDIDRDAIQRE